MPRAAIVILLLSGGMGWCQPSEEQLLIETDSEAIHGS